MPPSVPAEHLSPEKLVFTYSGDVNPSKVHIQSFGKTLSFQNTYLVYIHKTASVDGGCGGVHGIAFLLMALKSVLLNNGN